MKKKAAYFFLLLGLCVFTQIIHAEVLPGSIEPGRVGESLSAPPQGVRRAISPGDLTTPKQAATPLMSQAEKIHFVLKKVVIEGNTIYSEEQLSFIYKNLLNTKISVATLYGISDLITAYYRNNGYILSRAILPPQKIKGGVVHIRIIEGFIDQVSVVGNPRGARSLIQVYGEKAAAGRPLKIQSMERYLRLSNQIPGASVKAVLEPSKKTTGASDMLLATEMKMYNGYLSYDNYGTRYIGPREFYAGFSLNSFFRAGDSTRLSGATTSNSKELKYGELVHTTPLGTDGLQLMVGANYTETQPGFVLQTSNILGRAKGAYAMLSYPWITSRGKNLTVSGGMNYLDSKVSVATLPLYSDRIRSLKIAGAYDFIDRFYGSNLINLSFSKGLLILGANPSGTLVDVSRAGAHSDFSKLNFDISRLQMLFWRLSGFFLVKGQYGFDQLLASEQFGFGGPQIGRGYDPSEIVGDRGLSGTAELRLDAGPGKTYLRNMQFYGFFDAGEIWNINKQIQVAKDSATSAGGGVRVFFNQYLSGNLMIAKPLTRTVAAEELAGNGRRPRVFFAITLSV